MTKAATTEPMTAGPMTAVTGDRPGRLHPRLPRPPAGRRSDGGPSTPLGGRRHARLVRRPATTRRSSRPGPRGSSNLYLVPAAGEAAAPAGVVPRQRREQLGPRLDAGRVRLSSSAVRPADRGLRTWPASTSRRGRPRSATDQFGDLFRDPAAPDDPRLARAGPLAPASRSRRRAPRPTVSRVGSNRPSSRTSTRTSRCRLPNRRTRRRRSSRRRGRTRRSSPRRRRRGRASRSPCRRRGRPPTGHRPDAVPGTGGHTAVSLRRHRPALGPPAGRRRRGRGGRQPRRQAARLRRHRVPAGGQAQRLPLPPRPARRRTPVPRQLTATTGGPEVGPPVRRRPRRARHAALLPRGPAGCGTSPSPPASRPSPPPPPAAPVTDSRGRRARPGRRWTSSFDARQAGRLRPGLAGPGRPLPRPGHPRPRLAGRPGPGSPRRSPAPARPPTSPPAPVAHGRRAERLPPPASAAPADESHARHAARLGVDLRRRPSTTAPAACRVAAVLPFGPAALAGLEVGQVVGGRRRRGGRPPGQPRRAARPQGRQGGRADRRAEPGRRQGPARDVRVLPAGPGRPSGRSPTGRGS